MFYFAVTCGYLAACFIASAVIFRLAPKSVTATQLDERLWLFPALPLMLVMDGLALLASLVRMTIRLSIRLFERISGRKISRRHRRSYGYYSYGTPRRRKSKPTARRHGSRARRSRRMRA